MSDINSLSSYDYELPARLIANKPVLPKESAKLLVYERKSGEISHLTFGDLSKILPPCDVIFNDTKVIKARIYGKKESGGKIELLLNSPLQDAFSAFIKGRVKVGSVLEFDEGLKAIVKELLDDGSRVVQFFANSKALDTSEIYQICEKIGHVPLPPYIKRQDSKEDESWYQSIFAKNNGAVAAPTASLHFSDEMILELKKTHDIHYLTLHVGAGTFKGVENDDITKHTMHSEFYHIPQDTAHVLDSDTPILGIGTTVTRCVENYARDGRLDGACKLFLNLNNKPIRQNYLLTNFHLPKSTLIMLVSAFIGLEKTMEIYKIAIENNYRFYSYGDGMLII
ncbi:tRNA preQ1(34) S-adenosylmethionine ribosyltransferase-isomerase QueA [Campylobacter geochelonis]|uniref:tRNA preQ1(34) S-adenosylmethionine ribosyltransferase-isomerase QueA n=1 Tax=Campylobacter geochelonis TaxID=1780362 RepID=UPI000770AF51|nr:tRNA preQ1(34) S-adenosylmethionine ribosyltransferase-isomerase QueA [Campylobacter geochelonis]CZE50164.1 S-adenosylmethionine:tRNA ribosyltransferase-isomerase [Campylobacter geochelonis]